jgi:hypothetical protein
MGMCLTCRNFKLNPPEDDCLGVCRRYPPTIVIVKTYEESGCSDMDAFIDFSTHHPIVFETDWCGEFTPT